MLITQKRCRITYILGLQIGHFFTKRSERLFIFQEAKRNDFFFFKKRSEKFLFFQEAKRKLFFFSRSEEIQRDFQFQEAKRSEMKSQF